MWSVVRAACLPPWAAISSTISPNSSSATVSLSRRAATTTWPALLTLNSRRQCCWVSGTARPAPVRAVERAWSALYTSTEPESGSVGDNRVFQFHFF